MCTFPKNETAHLRIKLQRESALAFSRNREQDAIFFSTEALCAGIHRKFDDECRKLTPSNDTLLSLVNDLKVPLEKDPPAPDPVAGFSDLHRRCQQLPEEWTVFQISKCYTPRWKSLTHQEMLKENTCVEFILLKYPNSELLDGKPLMVRVDPPEEPDFFSVLSSIPVEVKSFLEEEVNSGSRRQDEIESHIAGIIDRLTAWLGPWVVFFSDNNLAKMSVRLQAFYKEWYQDFNLTIDSPPTDNEFGSILREADVMIYNGHGTGLQFIDGETILQQDIKSLIFLFGCDSVRLFAGGLFRDMAGSHLYYNIAKCPTVVGALWALTDYFTDYYSILLVGQWIPTRNPKFREHSVFDLDSSAFKYGTLQLNKKSQSKLGDENLLALMAQFRRRNWLPKRIRCAMVCRGLPAVNSAF